jgi:mono/diheme cytochrome c family protein
MRQAVSRYSITALIVIAANVSAWAQDSDKGRAEYLSRCAECHGADGEGSGPMSGKLKARPADLTRLAKGNNGVFSPNAVAQAVDGRSASKPHRSPEMPIWGCRQGPSPGPQRRAHEAQPIDSLLDLPCDSEQVTQSRIRDIVGYLSRIQEK